MDLVAGAVEEAGIDEEDALAGGMDRGLEVGRSPPLLVHDADLDAVGLEAKHRLDAAEDIAGELHFVRPVHLGLHHIDRAGGGVDLVAQRAEGGDGRIHQPFADRLAGRIEDGIGGHQVTDIADQ